MNEKKKDKDYVGHIIEIPTNFTHYSKTLSNFSSLKEELEWKSRIPQYDLFDGALIGGHFGLDNYHLGQRKGLNISGKKKPVYVIGKDYKEDRLFVGEGQDHPGLFKSVFFFPNSSMTFLNDQIQTVQFGVPQNLMVTIDRENFEAFITIFQEGLFLDFKKNISIKILEKNFLISTLSNRPFITIITN